MNFQISFGFKSPKLFFPVLIITLEEASPVKGINYATSALFSDGLPTS